MLRYSPPAAINLHAGCEKRRTVRRQSREDRAPMSMVGRAAPSCSQRDNAGEHVHTVQYATPFALITFN